MKNLVKFLVVAAMFLAASNVLASGSVSYHISGNQLIINYHDFSDAIIEATVEYADGVKYIHIKENLGGPVGTRTVPVGLRNVCVTWIQVHGTNYHYTNNCESSSPTTPSNNSGNETTVVNGVVVNTSSAPIPGDPRQDCIALQGLGLTGTIFAVGVQADGSEWDGSQIPLETENGGVKIPFHLRGNGLIRVAGRIIDTVTCEQVGAGAVQPSGGDYECIFGGLTYQEWNVEEAHFDIWVSEEVEDVLTEPFLVTDEFFVSAYNPSFSPNNCLIVFEAQVEGQWDLYVTDLSGSFYRQITNNEARERHVVWSDDWYIYFTNDESVHHVNQWGGERVDDIVFGTNATTIGDLVAYRSYDDETTVSSMSTGQQSPLVIGNGTPVTFNYDGSLLYWYDEVDCIHVYNVFTDESEEVICSDGLLTLDPDETGFVHQTDRQVWEFENNDPNFQSFGDPVVRTFQRGDQEVTVSFDPVQLNPDWQNGHLQNIDAETFAMWFKP